MSESLGATGRVQFVGAEQDVRTRLAAADIAVLPSRWEGMPTVLLEAMAAGLPVVASRVGEIPHVIEDGVFGRLVTPGDAGELASALAELLTDASRRRTWGQRAAAAVERYSLTRMIEQYEAIFRWAARGGGVAELEAMVPDDEQHA
jgi:glycosyltransferase involved in cell wall biosynthesis